MAESAQCEICVVEDEDWSHFCSDAMAGTTRYLLNVFEIVPEYVHNMGVIQTSELSKLSSSTIPTRGV